LFSPKSDADPKGHCFKYNKKISTHRENFLFNRTANYWNELPKKWSATKQSIFLKQVLIAGLAATELISCHSVLKTHSLVS
jgi:hypothetical protein